MITLKDKQEEMYHGLYTYFFGDDVEWEGTESTEPGKMEQVLKDIDIDQGMDDDEFYDNIQALNEERTNEVYKYCQDNDII